MQEGHSEVDLHGTNPANDVAKGCESVMNEWQLLEFPIEENPLP
jgi:hypothetical protein